MAPRRPGAGEGVGGAALKRGAGERRWCSAVCAGRAGGGEREEVAAVGERRGVLSQNSPNNTNEVH